MFAIPFGRMFWKEYRVHRSLWLSCLLVGVGLQCFLACLNGENRTWFFHFLTFLFPILYSAGCGGLLFASEREERTSDWLLALSAPTGPTLGAKFAFAIASTLTLQFALALVSVVLAAESDLHYLVMLLQPAALFVLIWSIMGSMLSRRMLTSFPVMLFWFVATAMWPLFLVQQAYLIAYGRHFTLEDENGWPKLSVCLMMVAYVAADVWLGWRWCQGKYLDGAILEGMSQRFDEWRKSRSRPKKVAVRFSQRAEYELPWRRTWQRLVWQERHRESQHLLWLASLCGLGIAVAFGSRFERDSLTTISLMSVFVIPGAMGALAFRADSSRQQPRFLMNRGIYPGSLWLAKQVVWLPRAFWITGVVFFVSLVSEYLLVENKSRALDVPLQEFFMGIIERPDQVIWFILLSYSCGQLAAILFQRAILSITAAVVLNTFFANWQLGTESLHLPQWWSLGLPVLSMFILTLWQMRGWLLEDHSSTHRFRLAIALTTAPVLLLAAFAVYRIEEATIPLPISQSMQQAWIGSKISQMESRSANDESIVRLIAAWQPWKSNEDYVRRIDEIVDSLKVTVPTAIHWNPRRVSAFQDADLKHLHSALRRLAEERIQSNEGAKAFEYLLASLRLARYSAKFTPFEWWEVANRQQQLTLDAIVAFAAQPDQTAASIDDIRRRVGLELQVYPPVTEAVVASFLRDSAHLIEKPPSESDYYENAYVGGRNRDRFQQMIVGFPWEHVRLKLLLTEESQLAFAVASSLEKTLNSRLDLKPFHEVSQLPPAARAIDLAKSTTLPAQFSSSPLSYVARCVYERVVIVRAASVRLALIAHRQKHGRSPDRLAELAGDIQIGQLIDPYSGRLFDYYPSFLLSAGPDETHIRPASATEFEIASGGPAGNMVYLRLDQLMSANLDQETENALKEMKYPERVFRIPPRATTNTDP